MAEPVRPPGRSIERLVVFGATGDLAERMLLPSLYFLDADGLLPPGLKIIGSARPNLDASAVSRPACPRDHEGQARGAGRGGLEAVPRAARLLRRRRDRPQEPEGHRREARRRLDHLLPRRFRPASMARSASRWTRAASPAATAASCWKSPSATIWKARAPSTPRWARCSRSGGCSASTTTSARRRCRTCWRCASPTPCSSPCGTTWPSTRCRSRWPRPRAWATAGPTTTTTAPCETWCRTTCSSSCVWWPWSRRPIPGPTRCATRRSRCSNR